MMSEGCFLVTGLTSNLSTKQKAWDEQLFSDLTICSSATYGFHLLPPEVQLPRKHEQTEPLNKPPEVCTISPLLMETR